MKLYSYYQSSAAYRVRIALGLKGLKPEMAFVNLLKAEQRSTDYEAVNPQRIVPAFIDRDHTITQSLAILEYLEEEYPNPALLPGHPFARAYVRSLALAIAADTSPLGNLKVRKYLADPMGIDEEKIDQWIMHWITEGLTAFEKTLAHEASSGKFCYGDEPGLADCCLIPQLFNADRWKCDLAPYPLIRGIREACEAHPAFIEAHPGKQKDAA